MNSRRLLYKSFHITKRYLKAANTTSQTLNLKLINTLPSCFTAQVRLTAEGIELQTSKCIYLAITNLWGSIATPSPTIQNKPPLDKLNTVKTIEHSLIWLFLHEVSHFELGHFELLDRNEIVEASEEQSFGLISRGKSNNSPPLPELADIDYQLLERCLELQADHEATDIFLNECSLDDVEELRQRIAAASAIMILIDIEDIKRNSKQTSHPKAATRIFQMLGHLCELPLVPAQARAMESGELIDHDAIPSEEDQQTFVKQIAIPALFDAIDLAKAADAEYIIDQLGDLPAFFDDVYLAKTNSDEGIEQFKTQGAKEWCQLKPINERILTIQRERGLI